MHNDLKREVADRPGWDYNPVSRTAVFRILTLSAHVYWDGKEWSAYITGPAIRELSPDVFESCYSDTRINVKDSEGNIKHMMISKFPLLAIRKAEG